MIRLKPTPYQIHREKNYINVCHEIAKMLNGEFDRIEFYNIDSKLIMEILNLRINCDPLMCNYISNEVEVVGLDGYVYKLISKGSLISCYSELYVVGKYLK